MVDKIWKAHRALTAAQGAYVRYMWVFNFHYRLSNTLNLLAVSLCLPPGTRECKSEDFQQAEGKAFNVVEMDTILFTKQKDIKERTRGAFYVKINFFSITFKCKPLKGLNYLGREMFVLCLFILV